MERHQILAAILGVCALNGILSPYVGLVFYMSPVWLPFWLAGEASVVIYLASLITATTTLLLGGVPAAVYERLAPAGTDTVASRLVWLGGCVFLSIPALFRLIGMVAGG